MKTAYFFLRINSISQGNLKLLWSQILQTYWNYKTGDTCLEIFTSDLFIFFKQDLVVQVKVLKYERFHNNSLLLHFQMLHKGMWKSCFSEITARSNLMHGSLQNFSISI